jgi:hypothetical protein
MLNRKVYPKENLDYTRTGVVRHVAADRKVVKAIDGANVEVTLDVGGQLLFNNMTLTLDRYFVPGPGAVAGNHGNARNEVELLVESLHPARGGD